MPILALAPIARNIRAAGPIAALVAFLALSLRAAPPAGVLEALVVILPAIEVTLFAFVIAFARGGDPLPAASVAVAFVLWGGISFIAIWLIVSMTQASIDAYVRLGAPPMIGYAL